jgi:hypothetical protein
MINFHALMTDPFDALIDKRRQHFTSIFIYFYLFIYLLLLFLGQHFRNSVGDIYG